MDLKDRKILITGANGGLGRAMAVSMAEHGAMLALCERTQALAEAAKAASVNGFIRQIATPN